MPFVKMTNFLEAFVFYNPSYAVDMTITTYYLCKVRCNNQHMYVAETPTNNSIPATYK